MLVVVSDEVATSTCDVAAQLLLAVESSNVYNYFLVVFQ